MGKQRYGQGQLSKWRIGRQTGSAEALSSNTDRMPRCSRKIRASCGDDVVRYASAKNNTVSTESSWRRRRGRTTRSRDSRRKCSTVALLPVCAAASCACVSGRASTRRPRRATRRRVCRRRRCSPLRRTAAATPRERLTKQRQRVY